jgi:hypothetical protein
MLAARWARAEMANVLLDAGADVHVQSSVSEICHC